jgi:hypothetical protein
MSQLPALFTVVTISVALSSATVFAIYRPLLRLLEAICPLQHTAEFWTRAAVAVLYLLPLCVVLVFGTPDFREIGTFSASEVARRALAASSFALVVVVIAIGLRLSTLPPPRHKLDYEPAPVR